MLGGAGTQVLQGPVPDGFGRGSSAPAAMAAPPQQAGGATSGYDRCKVYTVPRFQQGPDAPPIDPAVAAATAAPLLAAAASPIFDQQSAACQLLAKLSAWAPAGDGSGDGSIAEALLGALLDASLRPAVVAVLKCLTPQQPVHETVRRCIVSIVANLALFEETTTPGGNVLAGMLAGAGPAVVEAVGAALPGGRCEVHPSTFASEAARDALGHTMRDIQASMGTGRESNT